MGCQVAQVSFVQDCNGFRNQLTLGGPQTKQVVPITGFGLFEVPDQHRVRFDDGMAIGRNNMDTAQLRRAKQANQSNGQRLAHAGDYGIKTAGKMMIKGFTNDLRTKTHPESIAGPHR